MAGTAGERFVTAYNERDWDAMRSLLAEGCAYEQMGHPKRRAEGADEVTAVFRGWAETAPEARGRITSQVEGPAGVVAELDLAGSLAGPFGDYTPTGRPPVAKAALVFKLDADGRVTELRNYYDSLVLYQVLGIQD
jgi:steroid delta-isomerase-like uncharacterized protein